MGEFDESRVRQQGRSAARHGDSADTNPYLKAENMPSVTGENLSDWAHRHDVWHEAFRDTVRNAAGDPKAQMPPAVLVSMVSRRVRWIPEVQAALAAHSRPPIRVTRPFGHPRDAEGRNWDLEGFECGDVDATVCAAKFRQIVDRLRDEYDLR